METFVGVRLPDGGSLIVESRGNEAVVQARRRRRVGHLVQESFESTIHKETRAAHVVRQRVLAMETRPEEVRAEFAMKLAAEIGLVAANSTAEANLRLVVPLGSVDE